jgi:hypothetical protein
VIKIKPHQCSWVVDQPVGSIIVLHVLALAEDRDARKAVRITRMGNRLPNETVVCG